MRTHAPLPFVFRRARLHTLPRRPGRECSRSAAGACLGRVGRIGPFGLIGLVGLLALSVASTGAARAAGGSGVADDPGSSRERIAFQHHRAGLRARDKAWKYETRARSAETAEEREAWTNKAASEYRRAIVKQRAAIDTWADLYQAHSSLGYALRKLGSFAAAISAYDRALSIEPRYGEAVEYRAEAYLALDRLSDVQRAYEQLTAMPELAAQLRAAMDAWVVAHREAPDGVDPTVVEAFAVWVASQPEPELTGQAPGASGSRGRW